MHSFCNCNIIKNNDHTLLQNLLKLRTFMLPLQPCFISLINLSLSVHLNSVSRLILTNSILQSVLFFFSFALYLFFHRLSDWKFSIWTCKFLPDSASLTCMVYFWVQHYFCSLAGILWWLFFYLAVSFHHYYYLDYIQLYLSFNHALVSSCLNYCKTLFTSVTQDKS